MGTHTQSGLLVQPHCPRIQVIILSSMVLELAR